MGRRKTSVRVDAKKLGKKISMLLKDKDITVPEMATYLGVSAQAVYYYLNGEHRPTIQHLVAMSRVLGVTIDSIVEPAVA